MLDDEIRHGEEALSQGSEELPKPVQRLMWKGAKLMTTAGDASDKVAYSMTLQTNSEEKVESGDIRCDH